MKLGAALWLDRRWSTFGYHLLAAFACSALGALALVDVHEFAAGPAVVRVGGSRFLAASTSAIVGENDLRVHIDARASDETGVLARSFSEMVAHLREVLLRLRDLAAGLPRMSEAVSTTAAAVFASSSSVLARADETSKATASTPLSCSTSPAPCWNAMPK